MKYAFAGFVIAAALLLTAALVRAQQGTPIVEVYKTATCGCCANWVKHLQAHGFRTKVTDVADLARVKATHGVPGALQSCHTALVGGYVVEGHVPAAEVHKLLKQRPTVAGLAVPGMPIGSPGMESGSTLQPYDVLTFTRQGQTKVFASYGR